MEVTFFLIFFSLLLVFLTLLDFNYTSINDYIQLTEQKAFYACQDFGNLFRCDRSLNEIRGFLLHGISYKVYQPTAEPVFVDGIQGKAVELHANRLESIEIGNSGRLNSNHFSVSFWAKGLNSSSPIGNIVSHSNSSNAGWNIQMIAGDNSSQPFVHFVVTNFINNFLGNLTSAPDIQMALNEFVHIVGTFDGSAIRIYMNGALAGKSAFHGRYHPDFKSPLRVGAAAESMGTDTWSGVLDDLRLYNRTLSDIEIKDIFSHNSTDNVTDGLVGRWKFDNSLSDGSVGHNNGKLRTLVSSMVFTPDGRLFFAEKNTGNIRIMKNGLVLNKPFIKIADTYVSWEQGLLTLAMDPKFEKNHFIYAYYTAATEDGRVVNRLIRITDKNDTASSVVTLIDNIPATLGYHSGGALAFGPDDTLYIGVGDATYHNEAQNRSALIGKVLRINRDGSIPTDNPYPNSPVFTLGHRNIFGIAFDDRKGIGIIAENGDLLYDEINLIQKGGNYGFPILQPPNVAPELADPNLSIIPLRSYSYVIAPTQTIYYDGDKFPELKGNFLVGTFGGGRIHILKFDNDTTHIIQDDVIRFYQYPYSAILALAQSRDGNVYYGASDIYKLQSINSDYKRQILFPIEMNSTNMVNVKDLQINQDEIKRAITIEIDLQTYNSTIYSSYSPTMTVKVPKSLLDRIYNVTNVENNISNLVNSSIDTTLPTYNIIKMGLKSGTHSKLTIVGTKHK
jgi:glucose/arabinose dehydrogenase